MKRMLVCVLLVVVYSVICISRVSAAIKVDVESEIRWNDATLTSGTGWTLKFSDVFDFILYKTKKDLGTIDIYPHETKVMYQMKPGVDVNNLLLENTKIPDGVYCAENSYDKISAEVSIASGKLNGITKLYGEKNFKEYPFENDIVNGVVKKYKIDVSENDNGYSLISEENYKNGVLDGISRYYGNQNYTGPLGGGMKELAYENGEMIKKIEGIVYIPSTNFFEETYRYKKTMTFYADGKKDGDETVWYYDGEKDDPTMMLSSTVTKYENGEKVAFSMFDASGVLLEKTEYKKDGSSKVVYKSPAKIKKEAEAEAAKPKTLEELLGKIKESVYVSDVSALVGLPDVQLDLNDGFNGKIHKWELDTGTLAVESVGLGTIRLIVFNGKPLKDVSGDYTKMYNKAKGSIHYFKPESIQD